MARQSGRYLEVQVNHRLWLLETRIQRVEDPQLLAFRRQHGPRVLLPTRRFEKREVRWNEGVGSWQVQRAAAVRVALSGGRRCQGGQPVGGQVEERVVGTVPGLNGSGGACAAQDRRMLNVERTVIWNVIFALRTC